MTTAVETVRDEPLTISGRSFRSRLMVGTGKYPDMETMVRAIASLIRGLDPRPGAWTELSGAELKLFNPKVNESSLPGTGAPGEVLSTDSSLVIATGRGTVEIFEVQPAGKARMTTDDWLRGARVKAGTKFT